MLVPAPRMIRAVCECTQASPNVNSTQAQLTVQDYLSDPSSVAAVYGAILNRASAEPISLNVIEKCVGLLKQFLPRYKAPQSILVKIDEFIAHASASLGAKSPRFLRSLVYLQAMVSQFATGPLPTGGSSRTLHKLAEHQAPLPGSPRRGDSVSSMQQQKGRRPTLAQPLASQFPAHATDADFARTRPGSPRSTLDHIPGQGGHLQRLSERDEQHDMKLLPGADDAIVADLSAGRMGHQRSKSGIARPMNEGQHSSCLREAVAGVTTLEDTCIQVASAATPLHSNHVQAITERQIAQSRSADSASRLRAREHRPRLLFQHQAYSNQEPLNMAEREVAAVVEAVCGPAEAPAIWGEENLAAFWAPTPGWPGLSSDDSPGPLSASILLKLIMDLHIKAGPDISLPLVLTMLFRAADDEVAATRVRAYDVIYNLALHSEMLQPSQAMGTLSNSLAEEMQGSQRQGVSAEGLGGAASVAGWTGRLTQVPDSNSAVSSLPEFQSWLRQILFEVLLFSVQRAEKHGEVWRAMLGCLLSLTCCDGNISTSCVHNLSPAVAAAFLRASSQHHWAEQVQCHLTRLAVNLLCPYADAEVLHHLREARAPESRRNLTWVLLQGSAARSIQELAAGAEGVRPAAGLGGHLQAILAQAGFAEELQLIAKAGIRSHSPFLDSCLARALDHAEETNQLIEGMSSSMGFMQILSGHLHGYAWAYADDPMPPSIQPAAAQTLYDVAAELQGPRQAGEAQAEGSLPAPFRCLLSMLSSGNEWAVGMGQSWLLQLLLIHAEVAIADPSSTCLLPQRPRVDTPDSLEAADVAAGGHKQLLQRLLLLALTPDQQQSPTRSGSASSHAQSGQQQQPEPASHILATFLRLICIARIRCGGMKGDLLHPISLDAQHVANNDADSDDDPTRPSSGPSVRDIEAARDPVQLQGAEGVEDAVPGSREEPGSDAESSGSYGSMRLRGSFRTGLPMSAEAAEARPSDLTASRPPLSRRASHEGPLSQAGIDASFERPRSRRTSSQGPSHRPPSSHSSQNAPHRSSHDGVAASLQTNSSEGPRRLSLQGLGRSQESRKALLDNATRAIRAAGNRVSFDSLPPTEQHPQEQEEDTEQKERPPLPSSQWTRDDPVPVVLDTLRAAVDWLEAAPPLQRQGACLEAGKFLLDLMVTPGPPTVPPSASPLLSLSPPAGAILGLPIHLPPNTKSFQAAGLGPGSLEEEAVHKLGLPPASDALAPAARILQGAAVVDRQLLKQLPPRLPIQLFLLQTPDKEQLDKGNEGAADVRLALLLTHLARCHLDGNPLQLAEGPELVTALLTDNDMRVRYHAAAFLQWRLQAVRPQAYRQALKQLMGQAQAQNDDRLLRNPYMQMEAMMNVAALEVGPLS
ncbi:hypothetical protein WJX84_005677 [Apatococcus fuscideae]|uniref:Uncharacterized protein n=1 Tax=Apatococcus fuscideae TaxID=2026836 RepID=A0AAW1TE08_9CHLO